MKRRREAHVFSLAFLDAMTCGFGAVVLFFMVINAAVGERAGKLTGDLQAEVDRLEVEVLEGYENLVELRNTREILDDRTVTAQGLSRRMIETVREVEEELATFEESTLARKEHINQLQTDLKTLEESAKRLSAATPSEETPGDRVRSFAGDGDRQYLTGLKVGGQRILILVDSSASMLGDTVVNILRRRNLSDEAKLRADKWRQAVATVDWISTQIPQTSRFQIYTFAEEAKPLLEGSAGRWLDGSSREDLDASIAALRQTVPAGGTSLHEALDVVREISPAPDNVILLVDGLPTIGRSRGKGNKVTGRQRARFFNQATMGLGRGTPYNVILFPMEGDPEAASAYWKLAIATRGSFLTPSRDWP